MNPSDGASREYALDPSESDGVRPVGTEAAPGSTETTGSIEPAPTSGQVVVDPDGPGPATSTADRGVGPAPSAEPARHVTRVSAAWAAVVGALLLLVVLIIFVLQNPTTVVIHFLGWSGSVALGMAMLIAAVTGGLLVATIGVARLTQIRVRERRARAVAN